MAASMFGSIGDPAQVETPERTPTSEEAPLEPAPSAHTDWRWRATVVALASTANFLKGHGWQRGAGYQPGQPNFGAIQGWNAASVYQRAIAIIGKRIDGD